MCEGGHGVCKWVCRSWGWEGGGMGAQWGGAMRGQGCKGVGVQMGVQTEGAGSGVGVSVKGGCADGCAMRGWVCKWVCNERLCVQSGVQ